MYRMHLHVNEKQTSCHKEVSGCSFFSVLQTLNNKLLRHINSVSSAKQFLFLLRSVLSLKMTFVLEKKGAVIKKSHEGPATVFFMMTHHGVTSSHSQAVEDHQAPRDRVHPAQESPALPFLLSIPSFHAFLSDPLCLHPPSAL